MSVVDFIENVHREHWISGRAETQQLAIERCWSNPEFVKLLDRIESIISDQSLPILVEKILDEIASGNVVYLSLFQKNPTKRGLTEPAVVKYFTESNLTIERLKRGRVAISKDGDYFSNGDYPKGLDVLDFDFQYGTDDHVSHKFFRQGGNHQNHQVDDLMDRVLAGQTYLRRNPGSPFRFIALFDCHDPQKYIGRNRDYIDTDLLNSNRVMLTHSDAYIAMLRDGS